VNWFERFAKVIPLFLGGLVVALRQILPDGVHGQEEWLLLATAVVGGVTTYLVPNLTAGIGEYAKLITYAASLVIGALPALLPSGLTADEWFDLCILVATAVGVVVLPSQKHPSGPPPATA
jgi:hypothetical protein